MSYGSLICTLDWEVHAVPRTHKREWNTDAYVVRCQLYGPTLLLALSSSADRVEYYSKNKRDSYYKLACAWQVMVIVIIVVTAFCISERNVDNFLRSTLG